MRTSANDTRRGGARRWWALAGFAAAVGVAAALGNLAAAGAADEYRSIEQPAWAPPSWLFGPVWTVLYVTIALAGWLVWRRVGLGPAVLAWVVQLVLNAAWTPLFFGAGRYGLAFAEIVLLWLAIGVTILLFRRISTAAAVLLLPYWAWVTFAAALNYSIWQLNA
ncbi:TspO/MBR family protein [Micromonospora craniellae]|uniref:Tryptophan-rich sensory protein n=1 Tax=Micromonospora craniellae TaxID=2294034 RepID=A0A372G4R3_9ACTN|nr:TspO/MBR family protein [Micromonospora craniellae]QOC90627.1 tryptophan-rich sensory protein [Micromonospora craniellae]RFS47992.1 tryptophan-rich sensory protein [Micromonospora craniellae]